MYFSKDEFFFIITSDNLGDVKTRLYGYVLNQDSIIENDSLNTENGFSGDGVYVYVNVIDSIITVEQDLTGSFGLYLYREEDYFALSNSFMLLEDYVKKSHIITLNREYANYYIVTGLCSHSYNETLINEITVLDRNTKIVIDKNKRELICYHYQCKNNTIELNTPQGLQTLDNWFFKWSKSNRQILRTYASDKKRSIINTEEIYKVS